MTSKSLYSAEKKSILLSLITGRPILIALSAISLLGYFPVRTLLMLKTLSGSYWQNLYLSDRVSNFAHFLSSSEFAPLIAVLLGLYAGIEGFAWIFSRKKSDFYEALPISRRANFRLIFFSGLIIFAGIYLAALLLTLLIGAVAGLPAKALFACTCFSVLRDVGAFLAAYGIAILSCMLVGSLFYAVCMSGFFLSIGAALVLMLRKYMEIYFTTFAGAYTALPAPLSVPWHIERLSRIGSGAVYEKLVEEFSGYRMILDGAPHFAGLLVCALIGLLVARRLFVRRKVENAGSTVIHYPVQVAVKFLAAIVGGMTLGVLVEDAFGHDSFIYLAVIVLGITGLICIIIEMLYKRSIRNGLMSLLHVPVVMAITYIMLLFFRLDICSYDRFIPTSEKVESYAIFPGASMLGQSYNASYDQFLTDEGYRLTGADSFARKYMYLTNIEDIQALARAALDAADQKENDVNNANNEYNTFDNYSYNFVVMYRMKSGREIFRYMEVPFETDEKLLAAVIDTQEFKKGAYQVYHEAALQGLFDNKESTILFDPGFTTQTISAEGKVAELVASYKADMEELTFREMRTAQMTGRLQLSSQKNGEYRDASFPLYDSFDRTKTFLKENGIYAETEPENIRVKRIIVSRAICDENGEFAAWAEQEYTDEAQIQALQAAVIYQDLLSPWFDPRLLAQEYYIDEYSFEADGRTDIMYSFVQRRLLKDKMPAFVTTDLGE